MLLQKVYEVFTIMRRGAYAQENALPVLDTQKEVIRDYSGVDIVRLNEFTNQNVQGASQSLIRFYDTYKSVQVDSDPNR